MQIVNEIKDNILFPVDKFYNAYDNYKMKIEKINSGDLYLNILVWNIQSLNKLYKLRQVKLDFIRDILNHNKVDIIYLIDVNNYKEGIILNGFKKYDDGRNLLFVNSDILDEFKLIKGNMIFYSESMRLVFTYITPNSSNNIQIDFIKKFFKYRYAVFGDFNTASNKNSFNNFFSEFYGEDSLRVGLIGVRPKKFHSISGPSDHFLLFYTIKRKIKFNVPLRIKEISVENSKNELKKIFRGQDADFRPKVIFKQTRNKFNDGENIIDKMLSDYIDNKVERVFSKYNYLWRFSKKEPFLGTKVPPNVVTTFATHLKATPNKVYENVVIDKEEFLKFDLNSKLKFTKSKALTNEYFALSSITEALKEEIERLKKIKERNNDNNLYDYSIMKNILTAINKHKCFLISNTFFLVKNAKLENFADVRMIVIIPALIKAYEVLIYDEVVKYFSDLIHSNGVYQYGGVLNGSTYDAMFALRDKFIGQEGKGILFCDMSKGYDTVDLSILEKEVDKLDNDRIKFLVKNWIIMIKNMDIKMNMTTVQRTRGIAMGLSLSPIIFTFYVHRCLVFFDTDHFVMYIDDLCIIIPKSLANKDAFNLVIKIIDRLATFGLVINKDKTMLVSIIADLIKEFETTFPCVREDKYLGREIGINNDGILVADDRFYNPFSCRANAIPNFNIFGIRRLLFITALEAKNRYRFCIWSTTSPSIRRSIFSSNWYYFKNSNTKFSYIQMIFSIFNVFRFFIDGFEIDKAICDYENGVDTEALAVAIKNKLYTGIDSIDNAIKKSTPKFNYIDHKNRLKQQKVFMDDLFKQIKSNMLLDYILDRKNLNFPVYNKMDLITESCFFKNFAIVQNLAFTHAVVNKNKQTFIFATCLTLLDKIENSLEKINERYKFKELADFYVWDFPDISIPKNFDDENEWNKFIILNTVKLWKLLDFLLIIDNARKDSSDKEGPKKLFKEVFRVFTVAETIVSNRNLNDLSVDALEISFKIKRFAISDLADKFYQVVLTSEILAFDQDLPKF